MDTSGWPVILVVFPPETSDDGMRCFLRELAGLVKTSEDFALVFDASVVEHSSATRRKMMAGFIAEHETLLRSRCRGAAYVMTTALQRGVLTSLLWLSRHPIPYTTTADRAEAIAWTWTKLDTPTSKPPRFVFRLPDSSRARETPSLPPP